MDKGGGMQRPNIIKLEQHITPGGSSRENIGVWNHLGKLEQGKEEKLSKTIDHIQVENHEA